MGADRDTVIAYAQEQYGTAPEYPWEKYPRYVVLRRSDNQKWYGIIMGIPKEKLGIGGQEEVDILDIKCGPLMSSSLRSNPGFFPAYHMNKTNWITIILDGTVPTDEVTGLLDMSYDLSRKSK